MRRAHLVLAAVLVFQLVVIALLAAPWSGEQVADRGALLVPDLAAKTPDRIAIETGEGERVELARTDAGWTLPEVDGYPVDDKRVDELLDALEQVRVRRPVVSSARYHERLEVADGKFQKRLRVWAGGDEPIADLYFGTSPQYQVQHVRRAGEDAVYEARGLASWQLRTRADGWVDKHLVDVPVERVARVELTNASGSLALVRDGEQGWRLDGGPAVDEDKADALVRQLASLWISRPVGRRDDAEHGFAEPAARWVLVVTPEDAGDEDGSGDEGAGEAAGAKEPERITVLVGREDDGDRLVTREDFGYTAAVSPSSVEKALTASVSSLAAGS